MPNCSRRARFSRATCSCPPNIKEMVRRTIRIVFNIQAQSVFAFVNENQPPTSQVDFGEAQPTGPKAAEKGLRHRSQRFGLAQASFFSGYFLVESVSPLDLRRDEYEITTPLANSFSRINCSMSKMVFQ